MHKPRGLTVAVVDVLRASTTIAYAIDAGADRIIPVASIEAATTLAMKLGEEDVLLCGEREGKRIDGFHLGNSPQEYSQADISGKTLVLTTTNGTKAISMCEAVKEVVVASLVNVSAVVEYLLAAKNRIVLVCAGKFGRFSMEDALCAGMIVARLRDSRDNNLDLGDSAGAAEILYRANSIDPLALLRDCEHGQYLGSLGFEEDLQVCAKVDALSVVPVVRQGRIRRSESRM
ncbi:MAG: 2-phosphosulfolactate phosphatase [Candidatus Eisenbacteria sp.]|nr:2-phosphosulfolactate phosphatase [Candidatus Eisenbacteria bacterium]